MKILLPEIKINMKFFSIYKVIFGDPAESQSSVFGEYGITSIQEVNATSILAYT